MARRHRMADGPRGRGRMVVSGHDDMKYRFLGSYTQHTLLEGYLGGGRML